MKKPVLFTYVKKVNRKFIDKLADEHNDKISAVMDELIDAYREKRPAKFSKFVPKYVKEAQAWTRKNS